MLKFLSVRMIPWINVMRVKLLIYLTGWRFYRMTVGWVDHALDEIYEQARPSSVGLDVAGGICQFCFK